MLQACQDNFTEAEQQNDWFQKDFVQLKKGDALALPLADSSVDVAAQNCLFNIFKQDELKQALKEMFRVLKPQGRLVMSDPICEQPINDSLRNNEKLRALCLSGSIPLNDYLNMLVEVGFGTLEVRAKRPYRILDTAHYPTEENLYIESVEVCAIKDPMPEDGACIFTGKAVIYFGNDDFFDDNNGHILLQNQPLSVCDKTAAALQSLNRSDLFISSSTFHYDGGGCC
jgi:SAM-dependent methyltransferase